jgi:hypothetical protein
MPYNNYAYFGQLIVNPPEPMMKLDEKLNNRINHPYFEKFPLLNCKYMLILLTLCVERIVDFTTYSKLHLQQYP